MTTRPRATRASTAAHDRRLPAVRARRPRDKARGRRDDSAPPAWGGPWSPSSAPKPGCAAPARARNPSRCSRARRRLRAGSDRSCTERSLPPADARVRARSVADAAARAGRRARSTGTGTRTSVSVPSTTSATGRASRACTPSASNWPRRACTRRASAEKLRRWPSQTKASTCGAARAAAKMDRLTVAPACRTRLRTKA